MLNENKLGMITVMFLKLTIVFQNGVDKVLEDRVKHLQAILSGETTIGYHLEFLIRNNHADLLILKNTKVYGFF